MQVNLDMNAIFSIVTSLTALGGAIYYAGVFIRSGERNYIILPTMIVIVVVMAIAIYYYVGIIFGFTSPAVEGVQLLRPAGGWQKGAFSLVLIHLAWKQSLETGYLNTIAQNGVKIENLNNRIQELETELALRSL